MHTPTTADKQETPTTPLCEPEAAGYIGMSVAYLRQARMRGTGPVFVKVGRAVRYLRADLDRFLAEHRVETRSR